MSVTNMNVPEAIKPTDDCAVREVLDLVGDKWSVLIVVLLGRRTHRFSELHRAIEGISQRMLTLTLRALARDGLITRTPHATVPPRVDYELTDLGRTLLGPLSALDTWANTHREEIRAARRRHDQAS
ncbi:winged helix-turn-helix transcriptional regulator [Streptomyces antimycoticus]|uniref:Helix-turn-helix domain-containing protein n=3 Tax=Streptomyces TaxID=1883 RepID=A0ABD5JKZ4_9ACTN|nr:MULTISPECIES: helix-turn-helix domain-containing protein [Streptomyces]MEE4589085.1 helix-turn-helix domain-containing protein [Streptomyces sp. DSM 41602]KUL62298.1 HxlR family transcriptional regulator [Streptomyces violaceusniger]QTI87408.1 helix-turn-helix transcriptional regulator [Streptomyces sp. AgN23]RSS47769.1 transcriptional regulator [Streptomyces sp. WAC05858]WJE01902.1 helix-turn-helix domain-containing protein [Streptomyces antimycoticus]